MKRSEYLTALLVVVVFGWFTLEVVTSARAAALEAQKPKPPVEDWRPDIGHCFGDDIDLWDCITHKK